MRSGYSSRTLEIKSVPQFKLTNNVSPGQNFENISLLQKDLQVSYYIQCLRHYAILRQKPASFQDNFSNAIIQQRLRSRSNPSYPCLRQCLHQGNGTIESLASNPYQRAIDRSPTPAQSLGLWHFGSFGSKNLMWKAIWQIVLQFVVFGSLGKNLQGFKPDSRNTNWSKIIPSYNLQTFFSTKEWINGASSWNVVWIDFRVANFLRTWCPNWPQWPTIIPWQSWAISKIWLRQVSHPSASFLTTSRTESINSAPSV